MPSDDAIDGDVFGDDDDDDDDGGRGALKWGTCKGLTERVHAPLFLPNSPHFAKIYIFKYWIRSCLDTVRLYQIICNRLVACREKSTAATI